MPKYVEKDYSVFKALENIGDYFWRLYNVDLLTFAKDRTRTDIPEKIHEEWDDGALKRSPFGTDIRIEWALALYDHGDWEEALSTPVPPYIKPENGDIKIDPRLRYRAEYRSDNGIYVRSISELCIANFLYNAHVPFEYERTVEFPLSGELAHSDFYLPEQNVHVEYWGMSKDPDYENYKRWKEDNYIRNNIRYASLYPSDLKNLRDCFREALRKAINHK